MSTHLDGVRRDEPLLDVPETEKPEPKRPPLWRVHGALILGQCIFGGGSIVGKLGVARFNPMVFALLREVAAGILLMMFALYQDGRVRLHRRDAPIFLGCGVFIFTNQAAFIVGDKLAGAVLASAWQPTQPVFTLLISIGLGWERCTLGKAAGILISFGGAAFMVTFGQDLSGAPATQALVGNLLLFLNCLGTCLYVICAKLALARGYPPSTITAWSYVCGASCMAIVASGFSSDCALVHFVCPTAAAAAANHQCGEYSNSCAPWAVPTSAVLPLCYWVLLNSCLVYWMITWANQHAKAGFVLAYCALQPLVAMLLSAVILAAGGPSDELRAPGLNALGAAGVLLGLCVILREGKRQHDADTKAGPLQLQGTPAAGAESEAAP